MACFDACPEAGIEQGRDDGPPDERAARYAFFGVIGLVFVVGAAATIALCRSMSAMPDVPMPGGWSLSSVWAPAATCGQTWVGAAAAFVGMWAAMMIPMMLPSLTPALWTYWKRTRRVSRQRATRATIWVGVGYFFAWSLLGTIAFAVGATLAASILRSTLLARSMPMCSAVIVLIAGAWQFTRWKARGLACGRTPALRDLPSTPDVHAACAHGFRLAFQSAASCANLMAVLFSIGVMDPCAMLAATIAMNVEQFAPVSERTAKAAGAVVVMMGLFLIALAADRFAL